MKPDKRPPNSKRRQSIPARKCVILRERCAEVTRRRQLALRTSVSSTSVTAITGGGCSITSTATVSTAASMGCLIRRAALFTGARLGLALATARFAAFATFATLRALLRLAEFALRSFARPCTFDPFLRFAMIALWSGSCSPTRIDSPSPGKLSNASYQQDRSLERAWAGALPFLVALEVGRKPPSSSANPAMSCPRGGTARWGRKQSRWLRIADGFAVCGFMATPARYFDLIQAAQIDRYQHWPRMSELSA